MFWKASDAYRIQNTLYTLYGILVNLDHEDGGWFMVTLNGQPIESVSHALEIAGRLVAK